jgi:hypothetical protein
MLGECGWVTKVRISTANAGSLFKYGKTCIKIQNYNMSKRCFFINSRDVKPNLLRIYLKVKHVSRLSK